MATYQNKVYECSRQSASVVLNEEGTEWINEIKEGIKLDKGDTIRILGSFVNESAEGDQIEITKTMAINVVHTPYIKGSSLATANQKDDLIDVGMYGDVCYSTDATGIEPPTQPQPIKEFTGPIDANTGNPSPALVYSVDIEDDKNYQNQTTTTLTAGTLGGPGFNAKSQWQLQEDKGIVWGTTIDTGRKLSLFYNQSVDNELYLAQKVQKLILPVIDALCNRQGNIGQASIDTVYGPNDRRTFLEPLLQNAPNTGNGRFAGAPKPGMLIATVSISNSNGWYAKSGEAIYQANRSGVAPLDGPNGLWGIPNLLGGVESVIAKIIAVRPFIYPIKGKPTNCFEVYVTDFVNPATKKKGFYEHTFAGGTYAVQALTTPAPTNPITTGDPITCRKAPHGAGQKTNGYSSNPAFNPINGMSYKYTMEPFIDQYNGGSYTGYVDSNNPNQGSYASRDIRYGSDDSSTDADTEYRLGLRQNYGLSHLWNGGSCSMMRASLTNSSQTAQTYTLWNRDPASIADENFDVMFQQYSSAFSNGNPEGYLGIGDPSSLGAYICVNEATMLDIVQNGQDLDSENSYGSLPENGFNLPRIWFEYSKQVNESGYKNRHYVGNSSTISASATPMNNSTHYENRYGYDICGKPDNKNWILNTHDFGSTVAPTAPDGGNTGCTPYSDQNASNVVMVGTGDPLIYSSSNGFRDFATIGVNNPNTSAEGTPYEWCGYNTTITSTHFQQKDIGDVNLSQGNIVNEFTIYQENINNPTNFLYVEFGDKPIPPIGAIVRLGGDWSSQGTDPVGYPTVGGQKITNIQAGGTATQRRLTVSGLIVSPGTVIGQKVYIGEKVGEWYDGTGTNGVPWATDMLMIREHLTKIDVPSGYYTKEQLGARINDVLHYSTTKYALKEGSRITSGVNRNEYQVPTTIGVKENALSSEPTMINGNFLHSYIPELSYGFSPITTDNADDLDLTASTKDLTNELLTYDWDGTNFYNLDNLPAYNGSTVRYVWEKDTNNITWFGKHIKLYTIPYLEQNNGVSPQTHLIRLRGGSLVSSDFDGTTQPAPAPAPTFRWTINNPLGTRFSGWLEPLRGQRFNANTYHAQNPSIESQGTAYTYCYRTRGVRNLLNNGGSCRIFCGANNISVEFNELANRFNIYNLYTPIRPHASENPEEQSFSVDDAVPSSIINMKKTGDIDDSLTGLYISNLNGGSFTEEDWGRSWADNWLYDTDDDLLIKEYGTLFLDALGYVESQLNEISGFGIEKDVVCPYTFRNPLQQYGRILRGGAKITPALNGSNPFANECLNINPVQQYMIETESDDFFAKDFPVLGTSPYYFIGSDLPINHFNGNTTGTKLPVVGINARNFHSFGFSFDLGASSIEYVIDRPEVITSIKTAIYDSNLKTPTNISKYSSIIYLLTKNGYTKPLNTDEMKQVVQQQLKQNIPQPLQYFAPPRANMTLQPPVMIPPNFQQAQWNGSLLNPLADNSDDETF